VVDEVEAQLIHIHQDQPGQREVREVVPRDTTIMEFLLVEELEP
jgi:hypothetical protein